MHTNLSARILQSFLHIHLGIAKSLVRLISILVEDGEFKAELHETNVYRFIMNGGSPHEYYIDCSWQETNLVLRMSNGFTCIYYNSPDFTGFEINNADNRHVETCAWESLESEIDLSVFMTLPDQKDKVSPQGDISCLIRHDEVPSYLLDDLEDYQNSMKELYLAFNSSQETV